MVIRGVFPTLCTNRGSPVSTLKRAVIAIFVSARMR